MEYFDFSSIVDKFNKSIQYKKDNYYTNYYNHPIDEYDYTQEIILVEDWDGNKGRMTLRDFSRYIGVDPETVAKNFVKHQKGEPILKSFVKKLRENFRKIDFDRGNKYED